MRRTCSVRRLLSTTLTLVALVVPTGAAYGVTPLATDVPGRPGYTIRDPGFLYADNCNRQVGPFEPLVDEEGQQLSRVVTGIQRQQSFQIEVPHDWNGDLVVWAHGFNGFGPLLCAGPPPMREHLVRQGYAWAASSFATNGYDVAQGARDSRLMLDVFRRQVAKPDEVYLTGASMGGHITAVSIERYRHAYDGAMPVCGALGDKELFDYLLDVNVTAAALAGAPTPAFPVAPEEWVAYVNTEVVPELGVSEAPGTLLPTSPAGQAWGAAVAQLSGGTRPGFESAFGYWNAFGFGELPQVPFLFGLYPGTTGGTIGIARGNVTGNVGTVYQLDDNPALTPAEQALNAQVLRVRADRDATTPRYPLDGIPKINGSIDVPVLTLHDVADLYVPFLMEQVYAGRVANNGRSHLLTQRAIRSVEHCGFTQAELAEGFDDLVAHVQTGVKPAGDDVLDPAAVADPRFGCTWTRGPHPFFEGVPC